MLLVGGELALRFAGWPKKAAEREFTHSDVFRAEAGSQHLEAYPHKETGGSFRVSTDANGLRAPLHPEEKPAGAFRVMTLGCSTTFGWGVDDDQTYPARLEAILGAAGHPVEVINGGQPGHTTFQGLWMWERALARYQPDVVILGYIVQDARAVHYTDKSQAILQGNADFLKTNLLYRSLLYMAARETLTWARLRVNDRPPDSQLEAGLTYRVPPEEYVENLRAFKELADGVGAKLVLFGFPLERAGYTSKHRELLHIASEGEGSLPAPLYDPQAEFERYSASETLFFPQDRGHANAAGLDRLAQGMAQFLLAGRLVP